MATPDDVQNQLLNAGDKIKVYDGAGKNDGFSWAQLPDAGWWAWDLRGWVRQLTWDLLRFQRPSDAKDGSPTTKYGLRDSVNRQHLLAEQNNFMLKALCKANKIDLSGMPGV